MTLNTITGQWWWCSVVAFTRVPPSPSRARSPSCQEGTCRQSADQTVKQVMKQRLAGTQQAMEEKQAKLKQIAEMHQSALEELQSRSETGKTALQSSRPCHVVQQNFRTTKLCREGPIGGGVGLECLANQLQSACAATGCYCGS